MGRLHQVKTNFTAGEVSRRLLGRGDLKAYDNGALALRNLFIDPTGGVTRRSGLAFTAPARGDGRLVAFERNTEQTYLLLFTGGWIDVFQGGARLASIAAPWTLAQLAQITWTQSADTLLVCHPDLPPRKLARGEDGAWTLSEWVFAVEGELVRLPFHRFGDPAVTLTPSGTAGAVTVTASAPVFDPRHDGTRIRIKGKQLLVTGVVSPTQLNATAKETLADTQPTTVWEEQAFSPLRGWPVSAAFHQDRLVIGGSRDLPNRLWLSKSARIWNFDLGEGLDDEAIEFGILSDQVNAVRAVFSGRHLQVFTSGAEYMVTGDPLTPQSMQVNRQTRIGSPLDRAIPPRDVEGGTLFVPRNRREIREFLYTDTEAAYQANDLALLARHLVVNPRDQDYDQNRRLLFVAMEDGALGALTAYRAESVTAWTRLETDGAVRSVAAVGDEVYLLIDRRGVWSVERFDDGLNLDAAITGERAEPAAVWGGLAHLEGRSVAIVADGVVRTPATVQAGSVTLDPPAARVEIGLPYSHRIEPLPPNLLGQAAGADLMRLVAVTFRLEETAALRVDLGRGLQDLPLHRLGPQPAGGVPPRVSGDRRLRALGWRYDTDVPLWRIEQDAPLPFTLLSVTMELKVND
ncbi:hypothetical protein VY88_06200 [Azospirillum thiophilum]|uniref:Uncharacterized protein n=1 Tax=Azospirillum thiophilum TaxID=528244 RepID=A0AAC8VZ01_9PROT|nr:hypothetical protein [Azospirillum thiophilum]ALG72045.1 hypothetical protein AL072_06510 [Azospirillum thiophilum]KJR67151.1 hypothetical protein VY88_06200 [Azospirillum thiophilum]